MDFSLDTTQFECASSNYCKHFLKNPFEIDCGHYVCYECIPLNESLMCKICDQIISPITLRKMLRHGISDSTVDASIMSNLGDLFKALEQTFSKTITDLKEKIICTNQRVEVQAQFMKEEIELRVETLKNQLNELCIQLQNELLEHKQNYFNEIEKYQIEVENSEAYLTQLKNEIENNLNQTTFNFYNYQDKIRKLGKLNENFNSFKTKIEFCPSEFEIDLSYVGSINHIDPLLIKLKNGIFSVKDVDYMINPIDICKLSDDRLAFLNKSRLCVYDSKFNLQKTYELDDINCKPYSLTSDLRNRVYMSDKKNSRIILIDVNADSKFIADTLGMLNEHNNRNFIEPCGIEFYEQSLYVCDYFNRRIQKFSHNFVYESTHSIEFYANHIKINNNVACISEWVNKRIYFYDLPTFTLKRKYDDHYGSLTVIGSYFYEYNSKLKEIFCYNPNGTLNSTTKLILPINMEKYSAITHYHNGNLLFYADNYGKTLLVSL